jgi:hypothetical protein
LENGYITFGCLSRYQKVTPAVEALWAKVLHRVPGSKLLLKDGSFDKQEARDVVLKSFGEKGIGADRLEIRGGTPHYDHLAAYGDCDIILDSFPMGGGITTWESLYMGVPTVTKLGTTQASRIAETALAQDGTRYDHLLRAAQILEGSFLRRWIHSAFRESPDRLVGRLLNRDPRWICSELAAYCLDCQPEYADKGILAQPDYAIDPQELFEDGEIFAAWRNEAAEIEPAPVPE